MEKNIFLPLFKNSNFIIYDQNLNILEIRLIHYRRISRIKPQNSSKYINHKKFEIKISINTHIFPFHFHSYQTPYKNPTPPPFITFEKNTEILYTFLFFAGISQASLSSFSLYPWLHPSLSFFFSFLGGFFFPSSLGPSYSSCHNHHQPPTATMLPSPSLPPSSSFFHIVFLILFYFFSLKCKKLYLVFFLYFCIFFIFF